MLTLTCSTVHTAVLCLISLTHPHLRKIHTHTHYVPQCQYGTHFHAHTVPLTPEVVVEPRHQVERCVLFRGAFPSCSPCHLVPQTTPRFLPVFMGTLSGHSTSGRCLNTCPCSCPCCLSPFSFFGEVSLQSSLKHRTSWDDSTETVALKKVSPCCSPLVFLVLAVLFSVLQQRADSVRLSSFPAC